MRKEVTVGNKIIGDNSPCFVIAEIGINHNGSVDLAKRMIDEAVMAGCDAVKFQKRTVTKVYTPEELDVYRPNYYGSTNRDLKLGLELSYEDYCIIDEYCRDKKIMWFASCWDLDSVDFIEQFDVPCHKVASAMLTDDEFLLKLKSLGKPILLSTGMSSMEEIRHAVDLLGEDNLVLFHCTSTYPTNHTEINLRVIETFSTITNRMQDKQKAAEIQEILNTLPNSKNDVDAFMVRVAKKDPNAIMEILISRIRSTNEHVIPHHREDNNGPSNKTNYICLCGKYNSERQRTSYEIFVEHHPEIRSEEACCRSTELAVRLAKRHDARLHVAHVTTARELSLFDPWTDAMPKITAEAVIAHLLFTDEDYIRLGARIKCNPAVKSEADREALRRALTDGRIAVVGTDHAPHLLAEKQGGCCRAASGMPMVQFSLVSILQLME